MAKREAAAEAREAAGRERAEGARAQSRTAAEELRKRAEAAEAKVHPVWFITDTCTGCPSRSRTWIGLT